MTRIGFCVPFLAALLGCAPPAAQQPPSVADLAGAVRAALDESSVRECQKVVTVSFPTRLVRSEADPHAIHVVEVLAGAGLVRAQADSGPLGEVLAADLTAQGRKRLANGQVCSGPLRLVQVVAVEPVTGVEAAVLIRTLVEASDAPAWASDEAVRAALGLTGPDLREPHLRTFRAERQGDTWTVRP
ncbi:hypothetical protein [Deinococcus soli (ex Cha et al. 2016)]|uniref:hypothetical protein n=1 Tax=Deinococcus soli (ex Cha et al. 2016) TaxID=1309411 RepID=UPI00166C703A|nr:hypothetical protein [Deinococcus soli (ex Cha et al. 2016)]